MLLLFRLENDGSLCTAPAASSASMAWLVGRVLVCWVAYLKAAVCSVLAEEAGQCVVRWKGVLAGGRYMERVLTVGCSIGVWLAWGGRGVS
jgi:hypothetical protein